MKFGLYVNTAAANLAEYNRENKCSETKTFYVGFRKDADGVKRRYYADFDGKGTQHGEEYKIYFNQDKK